MNKAKSFHHKGHDYTVAPIENSEQYVATRDNRNVAYTDDINHYISTEFDEVRDQIAQLFTTKKTKQRNRLEAGDGQDATCQVGDGSAVVNEIPDSIKSLEGMQVIKVCGPKCKDCPCGDGLREYPSGRDMSSCVKIELVGGYYLCLAPLPNSVVTE